MMLKKSILIVSLFSLVGCQSAPMTFTPNLGAQQLSTFSSRVVYRVLPNPKGGWDVKLTGSPESLGYYRTKDEAIANGRTLAKKHSKSQLVIHKRNGQIEKEYTYGDDPRDIPG